MHMSRRFTSASKPTAEKSFDCCLSYFRKWSGITCDFPTSWENFLTQLWTALRRQTLPTVNRKHFYGYPLQWVLLPTKKKKTHNGTLLLDTILLKHCRHFDYWNQPLNMLMRVCYLDYHEAGLFCYLVIHIENILHPLQLFYFNLCPIYWLSLVLCILPTECVCLFCMVLTTNSDCLSEQH
jgi:hypothetical protein